MPQAKQIFDSLNPGESDSFGFDFTDYCVNPLFPGDTVNHLVPAVWTMILAQGTDLSPNHLQGTPSISGNITSAVVANCVAENIYVLTSTITTVAGRVLTLWQFLECKLIPQVAAP